MIPFSECSQTDTNEAKNYFTNIWVKKRALNNFKQLYK